jgi:hypothetical protein
MESEGCQNIRFVFQQIGSASLGYDLGERFARQIQRGMVRILPPKPYRECLNLLAESDVLVNFQPDTTTQIPSKFFDYLLLNRPILTIGKTSGALADLVRNYGFGDIFEPQDIVGIANYLKRCAVEKSKTGSIHANYPNKKEFDITHIAQNLSCLLQTEHL